MAGSQAAILAMAIAMMDWLNAHASNALQESIQKSNEGQWMPDKINSVSVPDDLMPGQVQEVHKLPVTFFQEDLQQAGIVAACFHFLLSSNFGQLLSGSVPQNS